MTHTITKLVAYYRVSTQEQGDSGLGLESQRAAVMEYSVRHGLAIVAEFVEIESGTDNDRPELLKAIMKTQRTRGASLIVKSQCRLARKATKALSIFEAVPVVVSDRPNMTTLEVQFRAIIDEEEARRISDRTKAALAALKARGVRLGKPENLTVEAQKKGSQANSKKACDRNKTITPTIIQLRAEGLSFSAIASRLNSENSLTAMGGDWHAAQVQRVLKRQA